MPHPCSRCGATSFQTGGAMLCPSCLLRLAALPESRIPEFEIETLLGSGERGTTYLARGAGGEMLAVRKLADVTLSPAADDLGAALAAFGHPHVAPVYGLQLEEDGVSLVRQFVRGRPFADWAASASRSAREAAVATLASAVTALHAAGLPHGRITASNIVVRGAGPVLLDAGALIAWLTLTGAPVDIPAMRDADLAALAALR